MTIFDNVPDDSSGTEPASDEVDNSFDEGDLIPRPEDKKWVPSIRKPFPTFKCTFIKKNGEKCNGWAPEGMLPDNAKCNEHGGRLLSVKEKARARVDVVRMRIAEDTGMAMDVIEGLMTNVGTADQIRLKAATEILDRAGIRGGVEIDVSGDVTVNTHAQVRERLARLALGKLDENTEDVIEGEVIKDEDRSDDSTNPEDANTTDEPLV